MRYQSIGQADISSYLFSWILIFSEIWKKSVSSKYWYLRIHGEETILSKWSKKWFSPKCSFPRNNLFTFSLNFDIFGNMGKTIFQINLKKKHPFSRNIDINGDLVKKRLFQNSFKITYFSSICWCLPRYGKQLFLKWTS